MSYRFFVTTSVVIAVALAGCGGLQPPIGAPGAMLQTSTIATHAGRGKSWIDKTSSVQPLLYVADDSGTVKIYTFPQAQLVGTLAGFNTNLSQECADYNGNVFILTVGDSSTAESLIYEYAHGASVPEETLTDPGTAVSCSVDSTTGNLAVANGRDDNNPYSRYAGDVAIYAGGQGKPEMLYSQKYIQPIAITYAKGKLYVVSATVSDGYELAEVSTNSDAFSQISLNLEILTHPTPVLQWDGKHVTLATVANLRLPLPVYRLQISGHAAHIVAATKLASRKNRPGVSAIEGDYAVAADNGEQSDIAFWNYPKGGKPFHTIKQAGHPRVSGLALSMEAAR